MKQELKGLANGVVNNAYDEWTLIDRACEDLDSQLDTSKNDEYSNDELEEAYNYIREQIRNTNTQTK